MDVGAVLIKLKQDTLANVDAWKIEIEQRKDEAIQTLQAEGVTIESWFHLELDGNNYLIAYIRSHDIGHAQQVARNSSFEIDKVHKQFKQNWERIIPATLLVDLENYD
ncbi:DUF6176 family protein [Acinetobacter junii]|uniref:Uncharacterized protein n=2 Tax=Acinetobacter junii TaxID=40215 RepID=S7WW85_ACIJU|nr:DUF6176 family protein [Acinetobacter junii]APU48015.1 hypothetical protein BVL33_05600 [Acinetobacter junii]EEY94422.1 hypothetical protein HMPREF0026_01698 [Acinetobacter junii SH205]ENV49996.1 hypothetical protein F953_02790 [Acinetobacter junii CIP 107470 = MTCC 11364]EPR87435.1 hypothetical protein L292_0022 [Acinetobacter junii CIP 107470 = MTCC 11364]MDH0666397.1 DUF6176 family protein [Acinetobacter junii]